MPITNKMRVETDSETFKEVPYDYNNWSSTVIFFGENEEDIGVYAFDSDECIVYYVLSYKRMKLLNREMGYTAGDFKVYFVGDVIYNEQHDEIIYPREVKVYDICTRQWVDGLPKLKDHKSAPFVFFLDGRLYVISSGAPYDESH